MKVAYVPAFGHQTISFGEDKGSWNLLSKNILNSHAPKHSAILEIVQSQQQRDIMIQKQMKTFKINKISYGGAESAHGTKAPSRQKSNSQLTRMNSRKKISMNHNNFQSQEYFQQMPQNMKQQQTQYEIDQEVSARLRWWKLGSRDDEEHGFRKSQSNNHIKILDLKIMSKESEELLNNHQHISKFYSSFKKEKLTERNPIQSNTTSQNNSTPDTQQIVSKLRKSMSTLKIKPREISPNRRNNSIFSLANKTSYLQKIKEEGIQKKKYFDTYLPSPRDQTDSMSISQNRDMTQLTKFNQTSSKHQSISNNYQKKHFSFYPINQDDYQLSLGSNTQQPQAKTPNLKSKFFNKRNINSQLFQASTNSLTPPPLNVSQKNMSLESQFAENFFSKDRSRIPKLVQPHQQNSQYSTQQPNNKSQNKINIFSEVKGIYDKQVDFIKQRKERIHKELAQVQEKLKREVSRKGRLRTSQSSQVLLNRDKQIIVNNC